MQANIQLDLFAPTFRLLEARPGHEPGGDPELNQLADEVNQFFSDRAARVLAGKRRELLRAGVQQAGRLEVTVLLTAQGLQLAYDFALPRKEIAPAPRKPLLRRILGPLWPYPKQDVPGPAPGEIGASTSRGGAARSAAGRGRREA